MSGGRRHPAGRCASAAAFLVAATTGCSHAPLPTAPTRAWLRAWERNDTPAMVAQLAHVSHEAASTIDEFRRRAVITSLTTAAGRPRRSHGLIDTRVHVHAVVGGLGTWDYTTRVRLTGIDRSWRVAWSPTLLHPALTAGTSVVRTRSWPARAAITGVGGTQLVGPTDTVTVGLEPDRITDRPALQRTLQRLLGVEPAAVDRALAAPDVQPSFFVPVIAVPTDQLTPLRPQLEPIPGVFFRRTTTRLGASPGLGSHILGSTGPITAEQLTKLGPPYERGDIVGQSGLELAFEHELAGTPAGDIHLVDAAGKPGRVLRRFTGTAPKPLATTLDGRIQEAAERALDGVTAPAAIVAVDVATGDLRAAVSRPREQPFNRALAGQYAPGSTGKIVTAHALLTNGVTVDTPVDCPPAATIGGKKFTNFEGEAEGSISFRRAFAMSCNTAFVTQAAKLPNAALTDAAALFGFGVRYKLPLPFAGGSYPTPNDAADRAATAIGQGRVLASPLHMATVAAAVASGTWHGPRLLASDPPPPTAALDPAAAAALRDLMGEVVRSGTGVAAAVAGKPLAGKTGTAEFGPGSPPKTHAWFVGISADTAFSVLVEGGGVGGRVAAPIAKRFVSGL